MLEILVGASAPRHSLADVIAMIAPNIPAMYEAHFAVPMAGAVLNTLNSRLKAHFQLAHSGAHMLFANREIDQTVSAKIALGNPG